MSMTDEFDLTHRDDLAQSWDRHQVMRDWLVRRARVERADAMRSAVRSLLMRLWRAATFASDATLLFARCGAGALMRWWQAWAEQAERRKAMAALAGMSDRDLWDIGLRRSEIYWATHHGRPEQPKRALASGPARSLTPAKTARPDACAGRDNPVHHRKHAA